MSINTLIALAQVDQQLQVSKRNLNDIQKELDIFRKEITQIETQISLAEQEKERMIFIREEKKSELERQEADIKRKEEKTPYIRNEKEFAASKKELEEARRKFGVLSDEFLDQEIKIEEIAQKIESLHESLAEKQVDYDTNAKDLIDKKTESEQEIQEFVALQKGNLESLPSDLKAFYERQSARGISFPFAPIVNKNCGGCHLLLPPQFVNELMTHPDQSDSCPHCGRILYYPPEVVEESLES